MAITTFVDGVTTVLASWLNFQDLHTQDVPASGTAHAASKISNTPAGGIAATNVQTAINELDTEKANLASPTFTGVPAAPTAAVDTNTTQVATTGFVLAQAASATPIINSASGTVGTSTRFARQDHAHPAGPAFSAYRGTSNQAIPNGTHTKIQFNAEEFDTANCFDSTTNYRFTPNIAGYYLLTEAVSFTLSGATTKIAQILLYKNGSAFKNLGGITLNNGDYVVPSGSALVYANGTTDYFELYAYQTSGGSLDIVFGADRAVFQGVWLRS